MARIPRPAARILLVDGEDRVLLMRFTPDDRPPLWCTPGGAVDPGESYAQAARRELWEEVGVDLDRHEVKAGALTELEQRVLAGSRWFARAELADWPETIYPADLEQLLS